jgi:hypothetical protein
LTTYNGQAEIRPLCTKTKATQTKRCSQKIKK